MTRPEAHPPARTEVDGDVWRITLDRPDAGNALNPAMVEGLRAAFTERPDATRAVLILGNGRRFCVGGDVRAFADAEDLSGFVGQLAHDWHAVIRLMLECPVPIVAGVHGAVAGAGVGLLGVCDVVVCGRSTTIRPAYGALGFSPDGGSSWALTRGLGAPRALELMLTNGSLTAAEAHQYGLVARLADDVDLRDAAVALAQQIASGPVRAMVRTRKLVRSAATRTLDEQLEDEERLIRESADDPEGREGVRAFVDRRSADFRNAR
jgi:2-(1,2-epoxy-1,2-dihydrophenyl)acetyl-CoA isomerase